MRIHLMLITLCCSLLVQSCGGDPLVGDWFACKDAACTRLDDDGVRFTEEGEVGLLEAPGSTYDPHEMYRMTIVGSYEYEDETLTVTSYEDGKTASIRAVMDGDDLILHMQTASSSCISQPGGAPKCKTEAPSTEAVRFKRVHDHMDPGPPPCDPPNTTTPAPAPLPPPPSSGGSKEPTPAG